MNREFALTQPCCSGVAKGGSWYSRRSKTVRGPVTANVPHACASTVLTPGEVRRTLGTWPVIPDPLRRERGALCGVGE